MVEIQARIKCCQVYFRSRCGEVASMDEYVALWDRRLQVVGVVDVRDANDVDLVQPVFKLDCWSVN